MICHVFLLRQAQLAVVRGRGGAHTLTTSMQTMKSLLHSPQINTPPKSQLLEMAPNSPASSGFISLSDNNQRAKENIIAQNVIGLLFLTLYSTLGSKSFIEP